MSKLHFDLFLLASQILSASGPVPIPALRGFTLRHYSLASENEKEDRAGEEPAASGAGRYRPKSHRIVGRPTRPEGASELRVIRPASKCLGIALRPCVMERAGRPLHASCGRRHIWGARNLAGGAQSQSEDAAQKGKADPGVRRAGDEPGGVEGSLLAFAPSSHPRALLGPARADDLASEGLWLWRGAVSQARRLYVRGQILGAGGAMR
ncbi:hypothetical protein C8R44DRAFT_849595 [Mycena epipterygia]|nr:hypothetical protein C8R44DRAFT_849595 [Mycena epipterygia]